MTRLSGSAGVLQRFSAFVGLRYAGARRRQQLVSFISGLSIAGMALGVGLLVVVLSVMNGFDRELREKILDILPHGAIYQRNGLEDWQQLGEQFLAHKEVVGVAPFVELQGMLSVKQKTVPTAVYGIDPEQEMKVSAALRFVDGEVLRALGAGGAIILGSGVAQTLQADVGQKLTLLIPNRHRSGRAPRFRGLRVIGIIQTNTELDHALALTDLDTAKALTDNPAGVSGLRLKFNDLFEAPDWVYKQVRQLPYGFYGSDWTRSHGNLYHAIQMSKSLVGLLLFLIVAIAAFNVVSTLVMVVVDKQGDIAILRTLGASRWDIMAIFMWQGSLIGVVGTLLGLLLGLVGALGVQDAVQWLEVATGIHFLKSDVYPVSYVPSEPQWQDFLLVGMVALTMSFLATLYPAWRASKVEPAEALRFE